jgi:endonuclease VIII
MPEGPETHRTADRLRQVLADRPALAIEFAFPHLQRHARRLTGEAVVDVRARGKALLTCFANGLVVYSHNQLYGRWYVMRAGHRARTTRSLRLSIDNEKHAALLYSASEIEVLEAEHLDRHPFLAALGPDALDPDLEIGALDDRLASRSFRGRALGALLLDQRFVAGLGNYLRADILFEARLHPAERPGKLDPEQRRRLAAAILRITKRSYRAGGVTNEPDRVALLRREGRPRHVCRHLVFARDGQPCWACSTKIERITSAGRRLYLCPSCQPMR